MEASRSGSPFPLGTPFSKGGRWGLGVGPTAEPLVTVLSVGRPVVRVPSGKASESGCVRIITRDPGVVSSPRLESS